MNNKRKKHKSNKVYYRALSCPMKCLLNHSKCKILVKLK